MFAVANIIAAAIANQIVTDFDTAIAMPMAQQPFSVGSGLLDDGLVGG